MNIKILSSLLLLLASVSILNSQDTFSIVALDSISGEVGSAGASCVDMDNFPGYTDDFLGELFPGVGAINTQAWYQPTNQANARARMKMGETPEQIIEWLVDNDVSGQPELRQYGIVAMVEGSPESAGHTGIQTDDYKNHVTGPNYCIQGNILLGQEILDSMETRFLNAEGDLACKLMAALQGANVAGADTRCASNGTSSLFAFVKVAQPADTFANPSFLVSVRTKDGEGIEPIDSLQTLFDLVHECSSVGIEDPGNDDYQLAVYPNPCSNAARVRYQIHDPSTTIGRQRLADGDALGTGPIYLICDLYSISGIKIERLIDEEQLPGEHEIELDVSDLPAGVYFVKLQVGNDLALRKLIVTD